MIERVSPVSVTVVDPTTRVKERKVHIKNLKAYIVRSESDDPTDVIALANSTVFGGFKLMPPNTSCGK